MYITEKCEKRMNILQFLKGKTWGASKQPMIAP